MYVGGARGQLLTVGEEESLERGEGNERREGSVMREKE